MLAFGGKSYLQTLAATLHLRLDQYMIGYLLDPAQVGLYAIAVNLTNLLLHAANAVLLALVARRLLARAAPGVSGSALDAGSILAALFFAVHPLRAESVAWVTERKNTLSMGFALGSLLLWLRYAGLVEDGAGGARARRLWIGAMLLFLAALFSKSVTAVLPAACLVIGWWKRGRVARALTAPGHR